MGDTYQLVNVTKRERIFFDRLPVWKIQEITGNPASAAIVTWYLFQNSGDRIGFVTHEHEDWPFETGSHQEIMNYVDVTNVYLDQLIEAGILRDNGIGFQDDIDPDIYTRDIRNAFMPRDML